MKIYFLINQHAGGKCADIHDRIRSSMEEAGEDKDSYCIEATQSDSLIEQIVHAFKQADTVIGMGGDGTVHAMINGYMKSGEKGKKMGLIPAGTGNDFFRHFCPYRKYIKNRKTYIFRLISGRIEKHSIWQAGETYFSNYFSIGYDAAVICDFDRRRKKRNKHSGRLRNYIAYTLLGIANMTYSTDREIILSTDKGEVRSGKGIIVSNVRRYAGGSYLPWENEDTLCAVPFRNSWDYTKLMLSRIRRKPVRTKGMLFFKQGKLADPPQDTVQVDGEPYDYNKIGKEIEFRKAGTVDVLVAEL